MTRGFVRTGSRGTKTLVMGDVKAISQQVPLVYNCSGHVDGPVQIVYGNQNWFSQARTKRNSGETPRAWALRGELLSPTTTSIIRRMSACWVKPSWTTCLGRPIR